MGFLCVNLELENLIFDLKQRLIVAQLDLEEALILKGHSMRAQLVVREVELG